MTFPNRRPPLLPAEVTSNPDIMGGMLCISGTRVPVDTIIVELQGGSSDFEIFDNYPTVPVDGIDAVRAWALKQGVPLPAKKLR